MKLGPIGDQGMPALLSSAVAEMWKSPNLAFSLCQMLTIGAIEALAHHASDELKARFLPKMVAGEWTGTLNLTEPQAGSDLSAVRTRAERNGEQYRLFGSKIFITCKKQASEPPQVSIGMSNFRAFLVRPRKRQMWLGDAFRSRMSRSS